MRELQKFFFNGSIILAEPCRPGLASQLACFNSFRQCGFGNFGYFFGAVELGMSSGDVFKNF
jgi:hypothetical protein